MSDRTEPDWAHERLELRQFIAYRLRAGGPVADDDLDQCVQDAWVKLYRWWCLEHAAGRPTDLDKMKNRIAGFAAADLVRAQVARRRFVPLGGPEPDEGAGPRAVPEPVASGEWRIRSDAPERLRLLVLSIFTTEEGARSGPSCLRLAQHFFADGAWQAAAAELRLTVEAVRKRWSRCVEGVRAYFAAHADSVEWVFEEDM